MSINSTRCVLSTNRIALMIEYYNYYIHIACGHCFSIYNQSRTNTQSHIDYSPYYTKVPKQILRSLSLITNPISVYHLRWFFCPGQYTMRVSAVILFFVAVLSSVRLDILRNKKHMHL